MSCVLAQSARRSASQSRLPCPRYGLRTIRDPQLAEDHREVVTHGLLAHAQALGHRFGVHSLCEDFQDSMLASSQSFDGAAWRGGMRLQECVQFGDQLLPRGLLLQQKVIAAIEWDETCTGYQRRECATLVERNAQIAASIH